MSKKEKKLQNKKVKRLCSLTKLRQPQGTILTTGKKELATLERQETRRNSKGEGEIRIKTRREQTLHRKRTWRESWEGDLILPVRDIAGNGAHSLSSNSMGRKLLPIKELEG